MKYPAAVPLMVCTVKPAYVAISGGGDALAEKWKLEAETRAYFEEKQLQPLGLF